MATKTMKKLKTLLGIKSEKEKKFGFLLNLKEVVQLEKIRKAYKDNHGETGIKERDLSPTVYESLMNKSLIEKEPCCSCLIPTDKGNRYVNFED